MPARRLSLAIAPTDFAGLSNPGPVHCKGWVWSSSVFARLRRDGLGQFERAVCDSGRGVSGGFAVAGDLHRREREFDAIGIERLFDHGKGLSPNDEILARQGHHFHSDLHREITERVDALHLQRLDDQRREFGVLRSGEAAIGDDPPLARLRRL
jgi:hypothetical protein